MLKMKKVIAILLAVCFLVSITAASASASFDNQNKFGPHKKSEEHKKFEPHKKPEEHKKFEPYKKHEESEVTKEVVATLKEIEVDDGVWELHLIKYTKETHHNTEVWFEKKWEFVSDDDDDE